MTSGHKGVDRMLSLCKPYRKNGKRGYVCKCPAHEDNKPSLSVDVGRNGNVILNCFGGCSVMDVLHAVGLNMEDLFDNPPLESMTAAERSEAHFRAMSTKWAAALDTLCKDATLAAIAAANVANGIELTRDDRRALNRAVKRMENARMILSTGPARRRIVPTFDPRKRA